MANATVTNIEALPAILTLQNVQNILGLSRTKVYELAHTEGFPIVLFGRSIRVPKAALFAWLAMQTGKLEGK
jgi:excisionase family DNA binding protein